MADSIQWRSGNTNIRTLFQWKIKASPSIRNLVSNNTFTFFLFFLWTPVALFRTDSTCLLSFVEGEVSNMCWILWHSKFLGWIDPWSFFRLTFCLAGEMARIGYTSSWFFITMDDWILLSLSETRNAFENSGFHLDLPQPHCFSDIETLRWSAHFLLFWRWDS